MKRERLKELHYITPIANVRSILDLGILCFRLAQAIEHESFAMRTVQATREIKRVPGGLLLHDYVNLYLHAHNPTLSKIRERHLSLCVLCVDVAVMDVPGVMVSDRHAASSARFGPVPDALDLIDWGLVFADTWKHPDDAVLEERHRKVKCAEVLVPYNVPKAYISGAYVSCRRTGVELRRLARQLDVTVYPALFFYPKRAF